MTLKEPPLPPPVPAPAELMIQRLEMLIEMQADANHYLKQIRSYACVTAGVLALPIILSGFVAAIYAMAAVVR